MNHTEFQPIQLHSQQEPAFNDTTYTNQQASLKEISEHLETLKRENAQLKKRVLKIEARAPIPNVPTSRHRTFPNGAPATFWSDIITYFENEVLGTAQNTVLHFEWPDFMIIIQCTNDTRVTGVNAYPPYSFPTLANSVNCIPFRFLILENGQDNFTYSYRASTDNITQPDTTPDEIEIDFISDLMRIAGYTFNGDGIYYKMYFFSKVPGITYDPNVPWPVDTPYASVYQSASVGQGAHKSYEKVVHDIVEDNATLYEYNWDDLAI